MTVPPVADLIVLLVVAARGKHDIAGANGRIRRLAGQVPRRIDADLPYAALSRRIGKQHHRASAQTIISVFLSRIAQNFLRAIGGIALSDAAEIELHRIFDRFPCGVLHRDESSFRLDGIVPVSVLSHFHR